MTPTRPTPTEPSTLDVDDLFEAVAHAYYNTRESYWEACQALRRAIEAEAEVKWRAKFYADLEGAVARAAAEARAEADATIEMLRLAEVKAQMRSRAMADMVLALRGALTAYGNHASDCGFGPALKCTCGWLDAIRLIPDSAPDAEGAKS